MYIHTLARSFNVVQFDMNAILHPAWPQLVVNIASEWKLNLVDDTYVLIEAMLQ